MKKSNLEYDLLLRTINALIPLCFKALSVVANITAACDSYAFVIHDLVPFKIHESLTSFEVVDAAPASKIKNNFDQVLKIVKNLTSEPFPGSDNAKQPIFSLTNGFK
jgi:hypothetical protein